MTEARRRHRGAVWAHRALSVVAFASLAVTGGERWISGVLLLAAILLGAWVYGPGRPEDGAR